MLLKNFNNLIERVKNDYFKKPRDFKGIKRNIFVGQSYNKQREDFILLVIK